MNDGILGHNASNSVYFYNWKEFNETSSPCRYLECKTTFLTHHGGLYSYHIGMDDTLQPTLVRYQLGWPEKYYVSLLLPANIRQSYIHRGAEHENQSSQYLLLGNNDYENMRVLLMPFRERRGDKRSAVIQKIPLKWAQARAELDRLWEEWRLQVVRRMMLILMRMNVDVDVESDF